MDQFSRLKLAYPSTLKALQNMKVAVVGLGGVGGMAVEMLARFGIKHLVLIDPDHVHVSNLNRQIISTHNNLGQLKTEAFKQRILSIHPQAQVDTYPIFIDESQKDWLERLDLDGMVDAIDTLSSKVLLYQVAQTKGWDLVSSMGMGRRKNPRLIQTGKLFKTYNDPVAKIVRGMVRKAGLQDVDVVWSTELPMAQEMTGKVLASVPMVVNCAGLLLSSRLIEMREEKCRKL